MCCLGVVLPESILSDVIALFLEGPFGIVAVSGAGLANLEACELISRHMVACSGAIAWRFLPGDLFR